MGFSFLGANGGDNAAIGDGTIGGYLVTPDKVNGLGAGGHSCAETLGEAANFVGKSVDPLVFGGTLREVAIFQGLASEGIKDGVSNMFVERGGQWEDGSSDGGDVVGTR